MIEENTAPKNIKLRFQCLVKDKHGYPCNARFHSLERLENHHQRQHCRKGAVPLSYHQITIDGAYITARKQECMTKSIALCCEYCHVKFIPVGCQVRTCEQCERLIKWKSLKKMKPYLNCLFRQSKGLVSLLTLTWALVSTATPSSFAQKRQHLRFFLKWLRKYTSTPCGYVRVFELKERGFAPNGDPLFFFHAHLLVDMPYVPQPVISKAWEKITKDSYIVDIRRAGKKKGLYYVAKYMGKPVFCDDEYYAEYIYNRHFHEISKELNLILGDFSHYEPPICNYNNGKFEENCQGLLRYWLTTPKTVPPPVGYLDSFLMYHPSEPSASPQKQLKIGDSNA